MFYHPFNPDKAPNDGPLQKTWDQFWVRHANEPDDGSGSTSFLVPVLQARKVRTVLCAGNGASREAHALAYAGFTVDTLDISPEANRMLREATPPAGELDRILGSQPGQPGGKLSIHTGDFRNASLCPGPFDVVNSRMMLQYFPLEDLAPALLALKARLSPTGMLVIESQNARSTRKAYWERLREQGFDVFCDLCVVKKRIFAPPGLCRTGTRPVAWVLSSTG